MHFRAIIFISVAAIAIFTAAIVWNIGKRSSVALGQTWEQTIPQGTIYFRVLYTSNGNVTFTQPWGETNTMTAECFVKGKRLAVPH